MLSRVSSLKRFTSGLNRDCRAVIGLSPSLFFIFTFRPPETKPSPQHGPNRACESLDISVSHSAYQDCPLYLPVTPLPNLPCSPPPMYETRRLVEAASALSAFLQTRGVPHAFYGDVLIALLANQPLAAVRSFVAERQTSLTVSLPSKFRASCKAGHHIRSALFVMPSAPRKISQPPRHLGLIGAGLLLPLPRSLSSPQPFFPGYT
jgi:hypothetical protein